MEVALIFIAVVWNINIPKWVHAKWSILIKFDDFSIALPIEFAIIIKHWEDMMKHGANSIKMAIVDIRHAAIRTDICISIKVSWVPML